ncbi:DUF2809 domain-containing protein [Microbacterium sp. NPDC089189]|uniref:DUF2809 domain-containing protein n=1 Tax=Microbacterium sp. NPDC089189 TaxID=3154972 RepID=UPI003412BEEE
MSPIAGRRVVAALVAVLTVAAGLAVHRLAPENAAGDIAGDALYAVLTVLLAVVVLPRAPSWVAGGVGVGWCVLVELFQLTGWPLAWASSFPPVVLVLGTVFDARDLVIYVLAGATAAVVDALVRGVARRRAEGAGLPRGRGRENMDPWPP